MTYDDLEFEPDPDCRTCDGTGEVVCSSCEGSGCKNCLDGQRECGRCKGSGYEPNEILGDEE